MRQEKIILDAAGIVFTSSEIVVFRWNTDNVNTLWFLIRHSLSDNVSSLRSYEESELV